MRNIEIVDYGTQSTRINKRKKMQKLKNKSMEYISKRRMSIRMVWLSTKKNDGNNENICYSNKPIFLSNIDTSM